MKDRQETGTSSREIVNRFWKALFSRDPEHIRSAVTPDVEWTAPPENATAVALGITHHMIGPDAIIEFVVEDFRRLFSNGMNVDIISVTAEENRVVFEQKQRATLAQGQQLDLDYVFIFETRDGRVSRVREYMDTRKGHMMVFGGGDMRVAP